MGKNKDGSTHSACDIIPLRNAPAPASVGVSPRWPDGRRGAAASGWSCAETRRNRFGGQQSHCHRRRHRRRRHRHLDRRRHPGDSPRPWCCWSCCSVYCYSGWRSAWPRRRRHLLRRRCQLHRCRWSLSLCRRVDYCCYCDVAGRFVRRFSGGRQQQVPLPIQILLLLLIPILQQQRRRQRQQSRSMVLWTTLWLLRSPDSHTRNTNTLSTGTGTETGTGWTQGPEYSRTQNSELDSHKLLTLHLFHSEFLFYFLAFSNLFIFAVLIYSMLLPLVYVISKTVKNRAEIRSS